MSPAVPVSEESGTIVDRLEEYLSHISTCTVPNLTGPPETKGRRASVAVVIRIQANSAYKRTAVTHPSQGISDGSYHVVVKEGTIPKLSTRFVNPSVDIKDFFATDWIRHGDAECLFIKRTSRVGDRWTGHVALPGGKRDPEDESDKAAAIRECMEEVGLDIGPDSAIYCGPLPQRLSMIDADFVMKCDHKLGEIALLCGDLLVFLLVDPEPPVLDLQAAEVAAAFWVPLRAILHPGLRTFEAVDISARVAKNGRIFWKWLFNATFGPMYNSAIRLAPSSISYSTGDQSFLPPNNTTCQPTINTVSDITLRPWTARHSIISNQLISETPLHLWGITYGVLADILEVISDGNFMTSFSYPFLAPWDYQFWSRALSSSYRKQRSRAINEGLWRRASPDTGSSLSEGRDKTSAVHYIFEGYYKYHDRAVICTIGGRLILLAGLVWWNWRSGWVIGVHRFRHGGGVVSCLGGFFKLGWSSSG